MFRRKKDAEELSCGFEDVLEHIYNINDMENGIISKIMK